MPLIVTNDIYIYIYIYIYGLKFLISIVTNEEKFY